MVMSPERAQAQEIRPLRIGLLNLMPKKIQTENQFARLIGATPLQIDFQLPLVEQCLCQPFRPSPVPRLWQPFRLRP